MSTAACASADAVGDDDAFARSEAVGLDDDGGALSVDVVVGSGRVGEGRVRPVGMRWRIMKLFAKSFELSSCAACCVGPKMRSPAA